MQQKHKISGKELRTPLENSAKAKNKVSFQKQICSKISSCGTKQKKKTENNLF